MPFSPNIKDREHDKFVNVSGETAVRTLIANTPSNPVPVNVIDSNYFDNVSINYAEISAVPASIETTIISFTVPATNIWKLKRVFFDGGNIAEYKLKINAAVKHKESTYYTRYNGEFNYESGLSLSAGDVITLTVIHARPYAANFNCSLVLSEST